MSKYRVWDGDNGDEEFCKIVDAYDAETAALKYADDDVDGHCDGLYLDEKGRPLHDVTKGGATIFVRDDVDGELHRFRVGVTELEPVYSAVEVGLDDEGGSEA